MNGTRAPVELGPEAIAALAPEEVDRWLDRLEAGVPLHDRLLRIPQQAEAAAIVFGDTHGDWRSTAELLTEFRSDPRTVLIGLGDYIDRPPDDCPEGSLINALLLLGLAAERPDRVVLLQGNHETARRVAVLPHSLPEEVDALWGPDVARYARVMGLLERGPFTAISSSGVYFAHAGFPARSLRGDPRLGFDGEGEELVFDVAWRDAAASPVDRGTSPPFTEGDLERFLAAAGCRFFLRGHDATLAGRWIYGDRCLTLHTTRIYERYGGVLVARVPLDRAVSSRADIAVRHLATEGRSYD